MEEKRIAIASWVKIVFVVLVLLLAARFISMVSHTIIIFALAGILAFILNPIVNVIVSWRLPRWLGVLLAYLIFIIAVFFIFLWIIPGISDRLQVFIKLFPDYTKKIEDYWTVVSRYSGAYGYTLRIEDVVNQLSSIAVGALQNVILFIPRILGLAVNMILAIVVSVYILYFSPRLGNTVRGYITEKHQELYDHLIERLKQGLGRYLIGQLVLSFIVGSLVALGSWLLAIPFPVILGLWAGITEIIPILGPFLGATPLVIIALAISPLKALWALIVFIGIQQLENHLLSPLIMGNILKVNPLVIIFALVAGAEIRGIVGMLAAIPIVALGNVIFQFITDYFRYYRLKEGDQLGIKEL